MLLPSGMQGALSGTRCVLRYQIVVCSMLLYAEHQICLTVCFQSISLSGISVFSSSEKAPKSLRAVPQPGVASVLCHAQD